MCMPIDKAIARPNLDEACILNGCTHCNEASVFFFSKNTTLTSATKDQC